MNKKTEITQVALQLFAEKGFNETSVQEIANGAKISKGGFYNYFKSKQELMLDLIDEYQHKITQRTNKFDWKESTSINSLTNYIELEVEAWMENQPFFYVLFREFTPNSNGEITDRMEKLHEATLNNHYDIFFHIYGKRLEKYISDLVLLLEGMMREYIIQIVIHRQLHISPSSIASWISHHMHSVIQHIEEKEPLLAYSNPRNMTQLIQDLKQMIHNINDKSEQSKYNEILLLIETEWNKENINIPLLEALLHFLKQKKELKIKIWQLEQLLQQGEDL
ncbi:transcriptional regulator, TetR family [Gracilibacillus ureilyticus]|uniref:Transcriptional regulator, TetR family n=1 Tax=Gracilibacillus ureilyticus TaxID=531814 RepID=A0A1H9T870_9BACI|nr:TetR/AcrR family transcriptional regulator [Gracilibacillus ureilyticus]SER93412.1 transcriptional regulator, TetR family [Gracilibacillus ureilyticus]